MAYILPKPAVIASNGKLADMICISEVGGVDPKIGYLDLHRPEPSMLVLRFRYGLDMESFWSPDKFLRRAGSSPFY
jgi:hypothetical protein